MPIILPHGLTTPEIRVLQEFRRTNGETLSGDAVRAIKHPAGGGDAPAATLVEKGFLSLAESGFSLTQRGRDFLAIDARPMFEEAATPGPSATAATAAANEPAEGV